MTSTAQELRRRAGDVRALANRLESTPLLSLDVYAGPDTWQCSAADEFVLTIIDFQNRILGAADDLRWQALQLERRAEQQEAADTTAAAAAFGGTA